MSEHTSDDGQSQPDRLMSEHGRRLEAHATLLAQQGEVLARLERRVAALERLVDRTAAQLMRHQAAREPQAHGSESLP
jgi:hypothetical protein